MDPFVNLFSFLFEHGYSLSRPGGFFIKEFKVDKIKFFYAMEEKIEDRTYYFSINTYINDRNINLSTSFMDFGVSYIESHLPVLEESLKIAFLSFLNQLKNSK